MIESKEKTKNSSDKAGKEKHKRMRQHQNGKLVARISALEKEKKNKKNDTAHD